MTDRAISTRRAVVEGPSVGPRLAFFPIQARNPNSPVEDMDHGTPKFHRHPPCSAWEFSAGLGGVL